MAAVETGKYHHEDGSDDLALATPEDDGNGLRVVVFPEAGGTEIVHHAPTGTNGGEFSAE